jgi:hypothetical protein
MDDQATNREGSGMRFRTLQIAWSVGWGIACLLLIALWVRSYWSRDEVLFKIVASFGNTVVFDRGRIELLAEPIEPSQVNASWPPSDEESKLLTISTFEVYDSGWIQPDLPIWHNLGFDAFTYPGGVQLYSIPFWFITLACVTVALLPWISARFSLRTLFIATTLVAVGLALAVFATRR